MCKQERIKAREGIAEELREAGYVLSHATGLTEDLKSTVAARQVLEISVSDITGRMKKAVDMLRGLEAEVPPPADDPAPAEPSSPPPTLGISDADMLSVEQRERVDRIAKHNSSVIDQPTTRSRD